MLCDAFKGSGSYHVQQILWPASLGMGKRLQAPVQGMFTCRGEEARDKFKLSRVSVSTAGMYLHYTLGSLSA